MTQINRAANEGIIYAVQNGDQYIYIYRQQPPYLVEPLSVEPIPPPVGRPPSWLLAARNQIVAFTGRDDEISRLATWRDATKTRVSVRGIYGPAGQGKTRLVTRFAELSARTGWTVAIARHRSEVAASGAEDQQLAVKPPGLLLVIDYADRWPLSDLIALVRHHQRVARMPLRILLVSRPGSAWWQSVDYQLGKLDIHDTNYFSLGPLARNTEEQGALLVAARQRFAEFLPPLSEDSLSGMEASFGIANDDDLELVLTVHMAALAEVEAAHRGEAAPSDIDHAGLVSYLLDRERDYWTAFYNGERGLVGDEVTAAVETMARTVYTATLTGPHSRQHAITALQRAQLVESDDEIVMLVHDHGKCYPPGSPGNLLEPLHPDRLGEDFIGLQTPGHDLSNPAEGDGLASKRGLTYVPDPWAATAPARLLAYARAAEESPTYTRTALATLIDTAYRWPHITSTQLQPLLRDRPHLSIEAGGAALSRLATLPGLDVEVMEAIEPLLPDHNIDLDSAAVEVIRRILSHRPGATIDPTREAILNFTFAYRLSMIGQYEEALPYVQKATDMFRTLADVDPDGSLHRYALAVMNLSNTLSQLGRHDLALPHAQECVGVWRRLAGMKPSSHLVSLAGALDNYASLLQDLGQHEEAIDPAREAIGIFRRLKESNPELYSPEYYSTLVNFCNKLAALRRYKEGLPLAEEAVGAYRSLAEASPEVHLPGLAHATYCLSFLLSASGRYTKALSLSRETTELCRKLAEANPVYLPNLVMALTDFGALLSMPGNRRQALPIAVEAVDLGRQLVEINPEAGLPLLANSLANLALLLSKLRMYGQAVKVSKECVDLFATLAEKTPEEFEERLKMTTRIYERAQARLHRHMRSPITRMRIARRTAQLVRNWPNI